MTFVSGFALAALTGRGVSMVTAGRPAWRFSSRRRWPAAKAVRPLVRMRPEVQPDWPVTRLLPRLRSWCRRSWFPRSPLLDDAWASATLVSTPRGIGGAWFRRREPARLLAAGAASILRRTFRWRVSATGVSGDRIFAVSRSAGGGVAGPAGFSAAACARAQPASDGGRYGCSIGRSSCPELSPASCP